jgi:hypothetical protein
MEHQIKALANAIISARVKHLIQTHVKELHFENNHLIIYFNNAAPLHELAEGEYDRHLKDGLEKVYGKDITYELRLWKPVKKHERVHKIPHTLK